MNVNEIDGIILAELCGIRNEIFELAKAKHTSELFSRSIKRLWVDSDRYPGCPITDIELYECNKCMYWQNSRKYETNRAEYSRVKRTLEIEKWGGYRYVVSDISKISRDSWNLYMFMKDNRPCDKCKKIVRNLIEWRYKRYGHRGVWIAYGSDGRYTQF